MKDLFDGALADCVKRIRTRMLHKLEEGVVGLFLSRMVCSSVCLFQTPQTQFRQCFRNIHYAAESCILPASLKVF